MVFLPHDRQLYEFLIAGDIAVSKGDAGKGSRPGSMFGVTGARPLNQGSVPDGDHPAAYPISTVAPVPGVHLPGPLAISCGV
jgi:hypothetical protein